MKIFYSPRYTIATHSFETTRKSRWIAESLARELARREVVVESPQPRRRRRVPCCGNLRLIYSGIH
jgi:hypothetical protein